ncbi:unnamed protein product [Cuscuta europaea]|uniref:Uncharacterized protein n=1 Tax=Cuscuta europaea TaxID=41803 RepID=A0A9P0YZI8_CUSEU|nr:unnamed protein product [Cuscuta europaea]
MLPSWAMSLLTGLMRQNFGPGGLRRRKLAFTMIGTRQGALDVAQLRIIELEQREHEHGATADPAIDQTARALECLGEAECGTIEVEEWVAALESELKECHAQFNALKVTADEAVKALIEAEENAMRSEQS